MGIPLDIVFANAAKSGVTPRSMNFDVLVRHPGNLIKYQYVVSVAICRTSSRKPSLGIVSTGSSTIAAISLGLFRKSSFRLSMSL